MSEPESLDAARRLLGTIQAGQVALTHLAANYLPFSRLKSVCELQADPYAASLPQVGQLVDGRLKLLRLSLYGAMAGGVAAPESTPGIGGDPSVMVWMEQVARKAGERAAREVGDRLLRESADRAHRRERDLLAKLDAEREARERAASAAEEATTRAIEALDRCAQLQEAAAATEERLRADMDRLWKESSAQSAEASVQLAGLEARLADGVTAQGEAQRRLEAAEERLRYAEQAAEDARAISARQAAEAEERILHAMEEAAAARDAERQAAEAAAAASILVRQDTERRVTEAAQQARVAAEKQAAEARNAAEEAERQAAALDEIEPLSDIEPLPDIVPPVGPPLEVHEELDLDTTEQGSDGGLSMTSELQDVLGGGAPSGPAVVRLPPAISLDTEGFPDLEPSEDLSNLGPAPMVGFPSTDEPTSIGMIPGLSLTAALSLPLVPRDQDQDAPTNPPVETPRSVDDIGAEVLKPPRSASPSLISLSAEDLEEEPQIVARVNRPVLSRTGDRDVLPDTDSSPARIAIPRDVTITARTARISAARSPSAPSEEVIITGEGGGEGDRGDDGTLKVSLEQVAPTDIKVPELTDDDEEQAAPAAPAGLPPVDEGQIRSLLADAKQAHEKGDLQKAIQLLSDALDMDPNRADAYINRGHCHLDLGDYSSAMSDFQRAEDLEPKKAEPHFAMGNLYFNRKEYKRAIEFYDHALELDGSHAMARCRRGISHYYRKTYRQAVQDLQAAFRLDPEIPNIKKYVQMAMKKLDRPD